MIPICIGWTSCTKQDFTQGNTDPYLLWNVGRILLFKEDEDQQIKQEKYSQFFQYSTSPYEYSMRCGQTTWNLRFNFNKRTRSMRLETPLWNTLMKLSVAIVTAMMMMRTKKFHTWLYDYQSLVNAFQEAKHNFFNNQK